MAITQIPAPAAGGEKRVDLFTATGTWVCPPEVTYAIAHLVAGGPTAGATAATPGGLRGNPGNPSSALGFTHEPGQGALGDASGTRSNGLPALANSGMYGGAGSTDGANHGRQSAQIGPKKIAGTTVIPGTSYPITVGAGGSGPAAGAGNGGSGYVAIEYWIG
jgi:hypothetical protein